MSRKFALLAAAVCASLTTPARGEPDELILRCKGRVGSFLPMSWTKDDELIAVHIKEGKTTVSGNDFLLGQNIQLCPLEPWESPLTRYTSTAADAVLQTSRKRGNTAL